jgi:hypothetical protein
VFVGHLLIMSTDSPRSDPCTDSDETGEDDTPSDEPSDGTQDDSWPHTDTDPTRSGATDPLPNRGTSDLRFGDLEADHDDASTLFDRALLTNPNTCPYCFARLGRQWELPNTKRTEDLDDFVTYIHSEEPYQIPEDQRSKLDIRYYQSETFNDRATFIPSGSRYGPSQRAYICRSCGRERGSKSRGLFTEADIDATQAAAYADEFDLPMFAVDDPETPERDDRDPTTASDVAVNASNYNVEERSLVEIQSVAETVSDTLAEYGISHDRPTLLSAVDLLKRFPDYDDLETLRESVELSIRAARAISAGEALENSATEPNTSA